MLSFTIESVKIYILIAVVVFAALRFYLTKFQSMLKHLRAYFLRSEPYLYFTGKKMSRILERCNWTTDSYFPSPFIFGGYSHMRAASSHGCAIPETSFEREIFRAPNGSTVAIDWFDHPEEIVKKYRSLLVIFNHGLNGPLSRALIRSAIAVAPERKMALCVINVQGTAGVPLSSPQSSVGLSFILEYKSVVERINQHIGPMFPKTAFAASMGGIPVVEFMDQEKSGFSSLVLVSCPTDLDRFGTSELLMDMGKETLKTEADGFTQHLGAEETAKAMEAVVLSEFLLHTIAKPWSHPNIASVYTAADPRPHLDAIRIPTLLIYALDDADVNFIKNVDLLRLCRNEQIALAVTEVGGHCGFQTVTPNWLMRAVCEFAVSSCKPVF